MQKCSKRDSVSLLSHISDNADLQADLIKLYLFTTKPERSFRKECEACEEFILDLFEPCGIENLEARDIEKRILGAYIEHIEKHTYAGMIDLGEKTLRLTSVMSIRRRSFNIYDKITTWKHLPIIGLLVMWITPVIVGHFCQIPTPLYSIGLLGLLGFIKEGPTSIFRGNVICAAGCILFLCYSIIKDHFVLNPPNAGHYGIVVLAAFFLLLGTISLFYESKLYCVIGSGWKATQVDATIY